MTILVFVLAGSSAFAAKERAPSFNETCNDLARLARDPGGTRDQWLQIIRRLVKVHRETKDASIRSRSIFLAGKAALALYGRSKRIEDLELAIRYFTHLNKLYSGGIDSSRGLQELKKALTLKERLLNDRVEKNSTLPRVSSSAPINGLGVRKSPANTWDSPAASPSAAVPPCPPASEPTTALATPTAVNATGNPFCPTGSRNLLPIPLPERRAAVPQRHASIAPPVMLDVPRKEQQVAKPPKPLVVVVDPGHGGKDPGAVSADGSLKEKDVTLLVALRLKTILEKRHPGVAVLLTRYGDVSVSTEERTAFANSMDADLFVSIHCNASTESGSSGIETYYLSAASCRRAMEVAARENGVPPSKLSDLAATPNGLKVAGRATASDRLANIVHHSLMENLGRRISRKEDRGVKRGPFNVLHGAKMPAILVECGFISNSGDRRKLRSPAHLNRLADAIAGGADKFLRDLDNKS